MTPEQAGQRAAQAEADRAVAELRVLLDRCDGHFVTLPVQTARAILWGAQNVCRAETERLRAEVVWLRAEIPSAVNRERLRMLAAWDKERDMRGVPG